MSTNEATPLAGSTSAEPQGRAPIVPEGTVAGSSLIAIVAIMTFLAAVTVGTMQVVRGAAAEWYGDVQREVTIQLRPADGRDAEADVAKILDTARRTPGVAHARAFSNEEIARLLEPWLGAGMDLKGLPLPRLVVVQLSETPPLDSLGLRRTLATIPGVSLDDHRGWTQRLAALSNGVVLGGFAVLALVMLATLLSVSFATRAAVATNRTVIEVLHFVGARDGFIARAFQRHFLLVGLQGAVAGGVAAALLFALLPHTPDLLAAMPGERDGALFLGRIALEREGYLWITGVAAVMALATGYGSRLIVRRMLRRID